MQRHDLGSIAHLAMLSRGLAPDFPAAARDEAKRLEARAADCFRG